MDKYTRWVNADNTLFVVLAKYVKPIIENGAVIRMEKTTVEMLDVHAEKVHEVTYEYFDESVREGRLRQILKPLNKT